MPKRLFSARGIHVCRGLGELDLYVLVRNVVLVYYRGNALRELIVAKVHSRQINGDLHKRQALVYPAPHITADVLEHIKIQHADVVALLQDRDKAYRRHELAVVLPAAKRLRAAYCVVREVDLRLIINEEFLLVYRVEKQAFKQLFLLYALFQLLVELGIEYGARRLLRDAISAIKRFHYVNRASAGLVNVKIPRVRRHEQLFYPAELR